MAGPCPGGQPARRNPALESVNKVLASGISGARAKTSIRRVPWPQLEYTRSRAWTMWRLTTSPLGELAVEIVVWERFESRVDEGLEDFDQVLPVGFGSKNDLKDRLASTR